MGPNKSNFNDIIVLLMFIWCIAYLMYLIEPPIGISIKDSKILISHINWWYLGWTILKFQGNQPNFAINHTVC